VGRIQLDMASNGAGWGSGFDDYGFWGCEGVTCAVNEMKAKGIRLIYNLNGHALVYKIVP
jgi:hypothetical protein